MIQTRNKAKNNIIIGLPTRIVVIMFKNIANVVEYIPAIILVGIKIPGLRKL